MTKLPANPTVLRVPQTWGDVQSDADFTRRNTEPGVTPPQAQAALEGLQSTVLRQASEPLKMPQITVDGNNRAEF